MGGPIVRTGTTPEFWKNWDKAFAKGAGKSKKAEAAKPAAKKAAKPVTKPVTKPVAKIAAKSTKPKPAGKLKKKK